MHLIKQLLPTWCEMSEIPADFHQNLPSLCFRGFSLFSAGYYSFHSKQTANMRKLGSTPAYSPLHSQCLSYVTEKESPQSLVELMPRYIRHFAWQLLVSIFPCPPPPPPAVYFWVWEPYLISPLSKIKLTFVFNVSYLLIHIKNIIHCQ